MKKLIYILILLTIFSFGCAKEKYEINLYFSGENAQFLMAETRQVSAVNIETIITELIKGPKSSDLHPTLPTNIKLVGATIEDDIAVIVFDKTFDEAINGNYGTSTASSLLINSVVGSLVYNDSLDIKGVTIQIEGIMEPSFGPYGYVDVFYPNESIFK